MPLTEKDIVSSSGVTFKPFDTVTIASAGACGLVGVPLISPVVGING